MAKQFVWGLKRPAVQERTAVLSDRASNPDARFELRLRRHDAMSLLEAYSLAEEKAREYVTGTGEKGATGYSPPVLFPPVGGEPVFLTAETCRVVAIVQTAQAGPQEDRYTFEEVAALCTVPAIGAQVARLAFELQPAETGALEDEPDPLEAPTGPQSGLPSGGSGSTPSASSGQTPSFAASMPGSEPSAAGT